MSGQGRAAGREPEPAQRPGPAELSEPTHGAPAPRISSPDAQSSSERRAQEDPYSVTLEPPQTPGDSGAGAAGGSSHLQEISGSPSSCTRGPARCSQVRETPSGTGELARWSGAADWPEERKLSDAGFS